MIMTPRYNSTLLCFQKVVSHRYRKTRFSHVYSPCQTLWFPLISLNYDIAMILACHYAKFCCIVLPHPPPPPCIFSVMASYMLQCWSQGFCFSWCFRALERIYVTHIPSLYSNQGWNMLSSDGWIPLGLIQNWLSLSLWAFLERNCSISRVKNWNVDAGMLMVSCSCTLTILPPRNCFHTHTLPVKKSNHGSFRMGVCVRTTLAILRCFQTG